MLLTDEGGAGPTDRRIVSGHDAGLAAAGTGGRHGVLWRMVEAVAAAVSLLVLAPLLGAISIAILIDDPGPVFFIQRRVGRYGRSFPILKFRTMSPAASLALVAVEPLRQREDDPRLTRFGRALRRSHLDELPQLLNVVAGQMSLVGPRPLIPDEDALVTRIWIERHEHRPGLTGAWQLHRSASTTVDELIRLDRDYLASWTPWRDVLLVATTVRCLPMRRGR